MVLRCTRGLRHAGQPEQTIGLPPKDVVPVVLARDRFDPAKTLELRDDLLAHGSQRLRRGAMVGWQTVHAPEDVLQPSLMNPLSAHALAVGDHLAIDGCEVHALTANRDYALTDLVVLRQSPSLSRLILAGRRSNPPRVNPPGVRLALAAHEGSDLSVTGWLPRHSSSNVESSKAAAAPSTPRVQNGQDHRR